MLNCAWVGAVCQFVALPRVVPGCETLVRCVMWTGEARKQMLAMAMVSETEKANL